MISEAGYYPEERLERKIWNMNFRARAENTLSLENVDQFNEDHIAHDLFTVDETKFYLFCVLTWPLIQHLTSDIFMNFSWNKFRLSPNFNWVNIGLSITGLLDFFVFWAHFARSVTTISRLHWLGYFSHDERFDFLPSITAHWENISQYDSTSNQEQKIKQIEFIQDKMMTWIKWIACENIISSIFTGKRIYFDENDLLSVNYYC